MPEPIVNPESAAPAAAPTPAPAAAPKAEDIATSFLAALETRTQRVEKSVAKSFSEQYWLSHTPLAGNDRQYRTPYQATRNFNPRSPCGERLQNVTIRRGIRCAFCAFGGGIIFCCLQNLGGAFQILVI